MAAPVLQLPNSLNLPPHLSAHKYFLVCTLTVAAWDTLVLSPSHLAPLEIPGLARPQDNLPLPSHLDASRVHYSRRSVSIPTGAQPNPHLLHLQRCESFYLFEPIATAILLAATSAVHVIRIHAIYDKNRTVLAVMSALFAVQVVVTGICCGFYRSVPLLEGQGCIAGPKHNWVGIYWVAPTLLYSVSLGLALMRSIQSLQARPLSPWKLMLRDGLNLYGVSLLSSHSV
ncbi:hypothetical protein NLJ89_g12118 [Agrocybe chaxingu]|uniref:Uncharacterized protein n=1 Tax=Agrocybe chaxingu TaxID=84603 RepID=A0A9W8MMF5_9AGAR|nr:hypothetical protein NLJ89_g12118 [Agrocybe chaxingu]